MSATVLVIDDEPMFQDLTRSVLSIGHHHVEVASNGFEALKLLGHMDFDVVIIDYHLPEMDGYALARLLIEHTRFRHRRPVLLAVTADPHGLAGRRGSDVIFAAMLEKPVAPRRLLDVIAVAMRPDPDMLELTTAATSLVANPDPDLAREASRAFWRSVGLLDRPRAIVVPPPSRDQVAALSLCFDLCGIADADLIVSTDPSVLCDYSTELAHAAHLLPVVGVNRVESPVIDLEFSIPDRTSWSRVATLIRESCDRRAQLNHQARFSLDANVQLLSYLFVHERSWIVGCGWPALQLESGPLQDDVVRDLLTSGFVRPCSDGSDSLELTPTGIQHVATQDDTSTDAIAINEDDAGGSYPRNSPDHPLMKEVARHHEMLALEPNLLVRDIMSGLIEVAGRSISFAKSEVDVARALEDGSRRLIILPIDAWPPTGLAGPMILARADRPSDIAVIATVPDRQGLTDAIMASGCVQGVLTRPIHPRALLDLVQALAPSAGPVPDAFDETIHRDLVDIVGEDSVQRLHRLFTTQLRTQLNAGPDAILGVERLRSEAHGMKAAAGMLGFKGLARVCEDLERTCDRGEDPTRALSRVVASKGEALAKLQELTRSGTSDTSFAA